MWDGVLGRGKGCGIWDMGGRGGTRKGGAKAR